MATVYLARQLDLDRLVAIKELHLFRAAEPGITRRFVQESRLAGSLSHANVVTVSEFFEHEHTPYIAMEYLPRGSLRTYVSHLTLAQVGWVLEGLLAGLAHAEKAGIVHRDIKPENLLVAADGRVKIADFGIAKASEQLPGSSAMTATGMTVGTPAYMAPEQALGARVGPWTDLYATGCVAYELFTGSVPFANAESAMAVMQRHISEPVVPAAAMNRELDQDISDWIGRLLVKDPEKRVRSASTARDEFEEIVIALLGPRWQRHASLAEISLASIAADRPQPEHDYERAEEEEEEEQNRGRGSYATFGRKDASAAVSPPAPGPATPPPRELPPGPLMPGPIDVPTGAPTPASMAAEPAVTPRPGRRPRCHPPTSPATGPGGHPAAPSGTATSGSSTHRRPHSRASKARRPFTLRACDSGARCRARCSNAGSQEQRDVLAAVRVASRRRSGVDPDTAWVETTSLSSFDSVVGGSAERGGRGRPDIVKYRAARDRWRGR
jgi:serine/threonine protein kinase